MQQKRTYTVIIHTAEEGGYWAEVEELPGCVSQGETRQELLDNIKEAIETYLEVDLEVASDIPLAKPEIVKVEVLVGAAD